LNSSIGSDDVQIMGTKGALTLNGGVTYGGSRRREQPVGGAFLARATGACVLCRPQVQASESPFLARPSAHPASERWTFAGENDEIAHVRSFVAAVRSRRQPEEDASFGHHAASCAHMINRSIRGGGVVRWDAANDTLVR